MIVFCFFHVFIIMLSFGSMFCTFCVIVLGFHISCLDLELGLFFRHALFMPLKILVSCCFCVCDNLVIAIELNILTSNIFKNVLFQNLSFHSLKKNEST